MIEIQVIDSGIGIKEDDIGKLFKLFGYIDSSNSSQLNTEGIGLGLNISKKIAQMLGGDVGVQSEWG